MHQFVALYLALDQTTSTNAKVDALQHYFAHAPHDDAAWALALLTGRRPKRLVARHELIAWAKDVSGVPSWLFDECALAVGDTAETIALMLDGARADGASTDATNSDAAAHARDTPPPASSILPMSIPRGHPVGTTSHDIGLARWIEERLLPLRGEPESERRTLVTRWWRECDTHTNFMLCKLLTGALRVGASRTLAIRALARASGAEPASLTHQLMGDWSPTPAFFTRLLAARAPASPDASAITSMSQPDADRTSASDLRPFPFYLASPLDAALSTGGSGGDASHPLHESALADIERELGDPREWLVEWKWDGIRAQLVRRDTTHTPGHDPATFALWSRGEELLTDRFPEIARIARLLPHGTVIDGEIVAFHPTPAANANANPNANPNANTDHAAHTIRPQGFAALQKRITRDRLSRSMLASIPCGMIAYDVLEWQGHDLRERPLHERREVLELIVRTLNDRVGAGLSQGPHAASATLHASEILNVTSWADAAQIRTTARARGVEGLMLKSRTGRYHVGRVRGEWWKWKVDPFTADLVLIYAQPGHGRRAGLFTDYGFAARDADRFVAVTKAYSGLSAREITELDAWIRANTRERFGPVRSVHAELVFEIAFEGAALSGRNDSGVALRFPRILRWRRDKRPDQADTLDTLRSLALQAPPPALRPSDHDPQQHARARPGGNPRPQHPPHQPGLFDTVHD
jgi:DNA ligase-1